MSYLILDLATTAIDGVEGFISEPSAPENYKDPVKIADYITKAKVGLVEKAGLDIDLGRITAVGWWLEGGEPIVDLCHDEAEERRAIELILPTLRRQDVTLIGFNALKFDWPLLMRRCLYLGINAPSINLDRYRSPHIDVWNLLSFNGAVPAHALTWYAKRLGWTDLVKPLSGAEEATAAADGRWDELEASVRHDLKATQRLAEWAGVLKPWAVPV